MYRIEVDQAGAKTDKHGDTVLAFSDGISKAILIPAPLKQKARSYLEGRARTKKAKQTYYLKLFAAGIVLLIKDYLDQIQPLIIDIEWVGQEASIKGMILRYLRRLNLSFPAGSIEFQKITKRSRAHTKAYLTYKRKLRPDHRVSEAEFLSLLS